MMLGEMAFNPTILQQPFNVSARHLKNKDVRSVGILNCLEVPQQEVRFVE